MTEKDYNIATKLVRGAQLRSPHNETSEALYMTSGFVYESAEQAAAAFRNEDDCFVYSRYGNPTVKMFEQRLALLEGAEACRATGTGMAAVFGAFACQLSSGDRIVASRALGAGSSLRPLWSNESGISDRPLANNTSTCVINKNKVIRSKSGFNGSTVNIDLLRNDFSVGVNNCR